MKDRIFSLCMKSTKSENSSGGEHHLDLHLPLVAVAAIDGMEREAAAHGVDDILLDLLVVVGDDEDARLLIDFLHEVVDDQTVEPCADQTHEHH